MARPPPPPPLSARKRPFNIKVDFPPPCVARNRTKVRGRINAMDNEIQPFAEADVHAAALHSESAESRQSRQEQPSLAALVKALHEQHKLIYTINDEADTVEIHHLQGPHDR